jgi:hypothetical protein
MLKHVCGGASKMQFAEAGNLLNRLLPLVENTLREVYALSSITTLLLIGSKKRVILRVQAEIKAHTNLSKAPAISGIQCARSRLDIVNLNGA